MTTVVAALVCAFVVLPSRIVAGSTVNPSTLARSTTVAVDQYWRLGRAPLPPALTDLIAQWRGYHLVKAVIAALVVVALVRLTGNLSARQAFGRRVALVTGLASGFALLVVIANVQGAAAPLASLLGSLPLHQPTGSFAGAVSEMHRTLTLGGPLPPPLSVMLRDFVVYHLVLALLAATLSSGFMVRVLRRWRRRSKGARAGVVVPASAALLLLALALINLSTAVNPNPAFAGLLSGSL